MKLKSVLIIFNTIVVATFMLIFLMPVFFLGFEFSTVFWRSNWYLAALFLLVLVVLNGYFFLNWPLFSALEKEDWGEIARVLENRVRNRGRYSETNIRLLVNAYIVSSRRDAVAELEQHLRSHNPKVLRRHVLRFGISYLLSNDGEKMERYFSEFRDPRGIGKNNTSEQLWVEWGYAFGLMLQGRLPEGRAVLETIARNARAGIIKGVALYLAGSGAAKGAAKGAINDAAAGEDRTGEYEEARQAFAREMPRNRWRKQVDRERGELHVLVLGKLLVDVEKWLYTSPPLENA